jgi:hypothetical protein
MVSDHRSIQVRTRRPPHRLLGIPASPAQCEDEREQDSKADAVNKHPKKHACSRNVPASIYNLGRPYFYGVTLPHNQNLYFCPSARCACSERSKLVWTIDTNARALSRCKLRSRELDAARSYALEVPQPTTSSWHMITLKDQPKIALDSQHSEFRWVAEDDIRSDTKVHPNTKAYV